MLVLVLGGFLKYLCSLCRNEKYCIAFHRFGVKHSIIIMIVIAIIVVDDNS